MLRLLIVAAAITVFIFAVVLLTSALTRTAGRAVERADMGGKTFSKLAYVALILLLFGVGTGWLGGL